MADYCRIGTPVNEAERQGFRQLRDRLPEHFTVIGNFELKLPNRANALEYDAVVIGEWGLYCVEIKGWEGEITGDRRCWELEWGNVENPFIHIEKKSKALRDFLRQEVESFPDELFCEPVVFLPREGARVDIDDPREDHLVRGDHLWDFFVGRHVDGGPGVLREDEQREGIRDVILPQAEPGSTLPELQNYVVEREIDGNDSPYREFLGRHRFLETRGKVRIKAYEFDPLASTGEREETLGRVVRDLEALSELEDNEYVAQPYDAFRDLDDPRTFYLISEWIGERTLDDVIAELEFERRLEPSVRRRQLRYGIELLRAVDVVHAAGIVHRNLHPGAVYLTGGDEESVPLQVTDFDYARMSELQSISGELSSMGNERYSAPELWKGEDHDARADVFSAGTVLFELLTGEPLFGDVAELMDHRQTWQRKQERLADDLLRSCLDRMLTVPAEDRLTDLSEAIQVLQNARRRIGERSDLPGVR
ncbi:MAG: NERD domain-containing protein kinase family protein [Bradymonadaceae bacterium]